MATKTWTNANSTGLWNDAADWSPTGVPGAADAVTVNTTGGAANLSGVSQNIGDLNGNGVITNNGPAATLTVNNLALDTFSGVIQGAMSLVKNGSTGVRLTGRIPIRGRRPSMPVGSPSGSAARRATWGPAP